MRANRRRDPGAQVTIGCMEQPGEGTVTATQIVRESVREERQ